MFIYTGLAISHNNMVLYIIFNCCVRIGVPFFFVASGFFYGIKIIKSDDYKNVLKKNIKRLLIPFIFWLIGIFEGLYFVSVGIYIAGIFKKSKINYKLNIILFILSIIVFIIEIFLLKGVKFIDDGSLYLSFLILVPSFFIAI